MALPLQDKVAFITGGGSGLGAETARRLARDGALVAINDLNPSAAESIASELSQLGRLDIMVNNAGIAPTAPGSKTDIAIANQMKRMEGRIDELEPMNYLIDMSDAEWDRMIRVHLYGAFYGTRAALRYMQPQRSGRIVNISSILGQKPSAGAPHYSVAKAAIITLTKTTAEEVAGLGINVNAVCPGYIDTPLLTPFSETLKAGIVMRIGKGHMGVPNDIAEMIRFLCGPESQYCTGDVFTVSGGYLG